MLKLIRLLPRRAILALAWTGGNIGVLLDRRGRKIGLANLDVAFGDSKTTQEKKQILRQSFVTFVRTTLDVFWFGNRPGKLRRYVELDDSMQILFQEKNQICITAHFGNWEVVGQSMAMKGFPFSSIAMPLKNPAVDRILVEQREITGQKIIQREGALRKLLGVLRAGGKTAFLVDQNTEVKDGGIWVTYFGLPVLSTPAPAALAAKTGSELITGFCIPLPRGKYRVYVADVRPAPENSDSATIQNITQKILTVIENEVRKAPHHWLWAYKRWKTVLRPEDLPHYPFYAEYDPKDL
ncbi:MAG: lysophospholipid acyltransferase family protein [Kiritimatiellales bacterium]